jgi:hypothetical protein
MGTNIADFVKESYRTLKPGGRMRIVEVLSRFESTVDSNTGRSIGRSDMEEKNGNQKQKIGFHKPPKNKSAKQNDEPKEGGGGKKGIDKSILNRFVKVCENIGFRKVVIDERSSRFFVFMEFIKKKEESNDDSDDEGQAEEAPLTKNQKKRANKNKNKKRKRLEAGGGGDDQDDDDQKEEEEIDMGEGFSANPCIYKRR